MGQLLDEKRGWPGMGLGWEEGLGSGGGRGFADPGTVRDNAASPQQPRLLETLAQVPARTIAVLLENRPSPGT